MKKNQGISLITLVITIIIMIIIAATVVISLSNSGIIGKAAEAVNKTNLQQVRQLATTAWMEEYMDTKGKATVVELERAVLAALEKNNIDKDKYDIIVTTKGVDVELKGGEQEDDKEDSTTLNEYGFYYNHVYSGKFQIAPEMEYDVSFVLYADKTASGYMALPAANNKKVLTNAFTAEQVSYSNKQITLNDGDMISFTVSEDGLTLSTSLDGIEIELKRTLETIHSAYRNRVYEATVEGVGKLEAVLSKNNVARLYLDDTLLQEVSVTISHNGHLIKFLDVDMGRLSIDGEILVLLVDGVGEVPFTLTDRTVVDSEVESEIVGDWEVAWEYRNGTWSDEIKPGEELTGEFVAKLYPLNTTTIPTAAANDQITNGVLASIGSTEGTAYRLVIEGSGKLPEIFTLENNAEGELVYKEPLAWQKTTAAGIWLGASLEGKLHSLYIKELYMDDRITEVGYMSFAYLPSLNTVKISSNIEKIGQSAFSYTNIETITLPNSLNELGEAAFNGTALKQITIPINITTYGEWIFYNCDELISVTLPNNLTVLPDKMFSGCDKLTSINIPNTVKVIGNGAFSDSALTSFNWPTSLEEISEEAFNNTKITNGNIPSTVKSIGIDAFSGCDNLNTVTLPSSVTSLGKRAFASCENLTSVSLNNVIEISEECFSNCKSLTTISISSNVTNLSEKCFYGCTALRSVTIPATVSYIGINAFNGCTNLMTVEILSKKINIQTRAFYSMPTGSIIYLAKDAMLYDNTTNFTTPLKGWLEDVGSVFNASNTTLVERQ